MGALQAGRADRPSAGRRGAGHEPGPVADHPAADRGVLCRRGCPDCPADAVRGRRREAVDLQLPGRGPRQLPAHPREADRQSSSRRPTAARGGARSLVPVGAGGAGVGRRRVRAARGPRRRPRARGRAPPPGTAGRRPGSGRALASGRAGPTGAGDGGVAAARRAPPGGRTGAARRPGDRAHDPRLARPWRDPRRARASACGRATS